MGRRYHTRSSKYPKLKQSLNYTKTLYEGGHKKTRDRTCKSRQGGACLSLCPAAAPLLLTFNGHLLDEIARPPLLCLLVLLFAIPYHPCFPATPSSARPHPHGLPPPSVLASPSTRNPIPSCFVGEYVYVCVCVGVCVRVCV